MAGRNWPPSAWPAKGVPGERIRIEGQVLDGDGAAVGDAMLEIWQADAQGRHQPQGNAGFTGFGRAETTLEDGRFVFETVRPGACRRGRAGRCRPRISASPSSPAACWCG